MKYKKPECLEPKKIQAIQIYLTEGLSWSQVAKRLKVSSQTVYRWRDDEIFSQELLRAHSLLVKEIIAKTSYHFIFSAENLIATIKDKKTSPETRVKALQELNQMGYKNLDYLANSEISEKIQQLEAKLQGNGHQEYEQAHAN